MCIRHRLRRKIPPPFIMGMEICWATPSKSPYLFWAGRRAFREWSSCNQVENWHIGLIRHLQFLASSTGLSLRLNSHLWMGFAFSPHHGLMQPGHCGISRRYSCRWSVVYNRASRGFPHSASGTSADGNDTASRGACRPAHRLKWISWWNSMIPV